MYGWRTAASNDATFTKQIMGILSHNKVAAAITTVNLQRLASKSHKNSAVAIKISNRNEKRPQTASMKKIAR